MEVEYINFFPILLGKIESYTCKSRLENIVSGVSKATICQAQT